jgi:dienelactone hydrolase
MSDFFLPSSAFSISKFPPQTSQDKADLQAFFGGTANPGETVKKLLTFGEALRADGKKKIGVYGHCWGE